MYLWNVKSLTNDLRADKVTENEKFKYLLLSLVVCVLLNTLSESHHSLANYNLYSTLIEAVMTGLGLYLCYKANYQGDNKDFVGRYICLLVPITSRIALPVVLFGMFSVLFKISGTLESDILALLVILIANVIKYIYIRSCIIDISSNPR